MAGASSLCCADDLRRSLAAAAGVAGVLVLRLPAVADRSARRSRARRPRREPGLQSAGRHRHNGVNLRHRDAGRRHRPECRDDDGEASPPPEVPRGKAKRGHGAKTTAEQRCQHSGGVRDRCRRHLSPPSIAVPSGVTVSLRWTIRTRRRTPSCWRRRSRPRCTWPRTRTPMPSSPACATASTGSWSTAAPGDARHRRSGRPVARAPRRRGQPIRDPRLGAAVGPQQHHPAARRQARPARAPRT